ncbi:MAG: class I SAM-dependent methyltransferase, partial [Deltaproteobacteria bacterium]|nr:class I SAM-dependent methyltransferase [Deltaproteobacteria bacterium]
MTADAILKKPAGWFGKRLGNKLGTLRRVARTAFDLRHENTEGVRELVTLVEHRYGHRETSLKGISLDRNGDPTPWYTYSAIDYLKQLDFSEKDVFEYGCGASTLFWSVRARSVTSVDDDEAWFARIARQVGPHRTVLLETERERYIGAIQKKSEGYDVIVIDGKHRLACAQVARRSLKPGGMIVVD